MKNIGQYIREHNRIVVLVLLSIGFALLYISTYFGRSSEARILMINLGAALIVSAIAMWILSQTGAKVEEIVGEEIKKIHEETKIMKDDLATKSKILKDELAGKLDLLAEAKKSGIVHIFEGRRREQEKFKKELTKAFKNVEPEKEVLIMSISLRDFFTRTSQKNEYLDAVFDMLKKNIKFRVLLLDPTSDAARARAHVEENIDVNNPKQYAKSELFTAIKKVAKNLNHPPNTLTADEGLRKKIKQQIHVRFIPYDPTTHLIITDKFTFVEQYHRGGGEEIRMALEKGGIRNIVCFGGFAPVLMIENSALFAKLMKSHFMNIWNSPDVKEKDLRKRDYYKKNISRYEYGE